MGQDDPLIRKTALTSTNVELPEVLRQAVDGLRTELDEMGHEISLAELVRVVLFRAILEPPAAFPAELQAYKTARVSDVPTKLLKVVPLRGPGRRKRKAIRE